MPAARAIFTAPGGGRGPAWTTVKAAAVDTGGALGVVQGVIPFGHSPRLHVHRHEDEAFFVVAGAIDFVCGAERFRGESGAFAFLPRGLAHSFLGLSRPHAEALMLMIPGGFEDVFLETDPERLDALLAAHGVEFVGAPLSP